MAEEIEKIYIIPLKKKGYKSNRNAAPTAVKRVKEYLTKHMKVEQDSIWIDDSLNKAIWEKGKYKMDGKIRVKAVKFDDGVVEAYIPELEFKKSRRELLKEEKEKKEPILKKDEVEAEEADTGAEDYDIAPGADGEVKIKKKKAPKEKKPAKPKKETKKSSKKKTEPKKTERKSTPKKKPSSKSTTKKSTSKKTKK